MEELDKKYNPKTLEDKWFSYWENNQFFKASVDPKKKPFTVMIPPPNVTSILHMGHGLNNTIQDVIVRYKRMDGFNALWIAGTDHAGIATQNVVEKMLAKEGKKRQDLGREKFLEKVWEWKNKYGDAIINQLKKIGCSCDWDRTRFTMDEGLSKAVREAFVRLYEDGLVYKGEYIINWCPRCTTALSDEEVEHKEENGHLYHIKYYIKGSNDFLTVATVRPETLLGDTAVAVHPDDERYQKYIGKMVILPILEKEIPVIADPYVEKEFGTGVLKVTPAHDTNDFELGLKHKLPIINILTPEGKMNHLAGEYQGLDRFACRKKIVEDLKEKDLLVKEEPYLKSVGRCYRCDCVVEPYVSSQWFVKMKPLAEKAIMVVEKDEVTLMPDMWKKVYLNWMNNIRDWCISRQIWWGHRIPAWYCKDCNEITVSKETPTQCVKCGSKHIEQETDVLDTWFSSWLWPISTLGWPEKTQDLEYFYPTQFLSTAPEILFFWVARMIMSGLYFENKVPFKDVYLHSTVCDTHGKKMSKSLGNGIDPLEIVDQYGADSLRFTILYLAPVGQRIRLAKNSFEIGFRFCNKLWNSARFIFMNLEGTEVKNIQSIQLDDWDKWILASLNETTAKMRKYMDSYRFNEMADTLYHFIWGDFCDWYVEVSKIKIYSKNHEEKTAAISVLTHVLERSLRLLHPIMPFITEEIWQKIPGRTGKTIMKADYPKPEGFDFSESNKAIESIKEVIYHIRNIRGDLAIAPEKKVSAILSTADKAKEKTFSTYLESIKTLSKAEFIDLIQVHSKPDKTISAVGTGFEVFVKLDGVLDFDKELERIEKEMAKLEKELSFIQGKLSNPEFVDKAPEAVVTKEKERQKEFLQKMEKLGALLKSLKK